MTDDTFSVLFPRPEYLLQNQLSIEVDHLISNLIIVDITETVPIVGGQQILLIWC